MWEAGGQTSLHPNTQDGQARATLDIQLGSPADPRPGAPEVGKDGPGPSHGPQHRQNPHHHRPRRRGPAARVRDEMRRAAWLQQQGQKQQPDATVAGTSDTQTVLSHDKNTMPANILESSEVNEAEKISTDMVISDYINTFPANALESSDIEEVGTSLSCDLCEFVAESSNHLKNHKIRKHMNIPQLDGGSFECRQTDCWWEKRFRNPLKVFQVFKDVLMDIEESPLTEEEKCFERESVTSARKEVLGDNFQFFPPWSCS